MTQGLRSRQQIENRPERRVPEQVPSWAWGAIFVGCSILLALLIHFEAFKR